MTTARIFIIILILSGGWAGPTSADHPSEKEIGKLIEEEKSELEILKKKIDQQDREISSMGKK